MERRNFPRYPQKPLKLEHLADLMPPTGKFPPGEAWKWEKIFGDLREFLQTLKNDVHNARYQKGEKGGYTGTFTEHTGKTVTVTNGTVITVA